MNRPHVTLAVIGLIAAAAAIAGPLTPPGGPVTSTYKTLTEVEPRTAISATNTPGNANASYVITQPGAYYLTGDITVPSGKSGIQVYGTSITIDLNGFTIHGSAGSQHGITASGIYWSTLTVKNGAIENCGGNGIDFATVWAAHVSDVTCFQNGGAGVSMFDGIVEHCTAYANHHGFASTSGWVSFLSCTSTANTGNGFQSSGGSLFDACAANNNGAQGFNIGQGSTIRNCAAHSNLSQGIVCSAYCTVSGNHVFANGNGNNAGVWATSGGNTIQDNDVTDNGYGIYIGGAGNIIIKNRVGTSAQANYYIVPGNRVGLITTGTPNGTLINGNSGGGLGTGDPNANFVF